MNTPPKSFILCNIPIKYPKNRIFQTFQYICIIEYIDFIVPLNNSLLCQAIVYVEKWFHGTISTQFVESLKRNRNCPIERIRPFDFIINHFQVWKIMPNTICNSNKGYKKIHGFADEHIIVKIKKKPIDIYEEMESTEDEYEYSDQE